MDYTAALRELRRELDRVNRAIERLERKIGNVSNRGRKNMPDKERQEVSRRMTQYWAKRRTKADESQTPDS